jgi:hypothetical protein
LNLDPAKAVAEITKLWERGSFLLWALAIGTFAGFLVLAAIALTGSPPFVQANNLASPWLLLASTGLAALAAFKHYQERSTQTVRLVPNEVQSSYHAAKQPNGMMNTQIIIDMQVFNISDKSIWLPNVKLLRPKSPWMALSKVVTLREQSSAYHGTYELPPGAKTNGSVHFMIQGDLTDQIARRGVKLCIEDQFGHKHKLNLPNLTCR